jgi:hypothetical protein
MLAGSRLELFAPADAVLTFPTETRVG